MRSRGKREKWRLAVVEAAGEFCGRAGQRSGSESLSDKAAEWKL